MSSRIRCRRPLPEFSPERAQETQGDVIERNRAALDEEIREAHTIARRRESQ